MKDCLVVRLKGIVDNNTLPYFNSFKLDLSGESNAFSGKISCSQDITIKDNEGGSITVTGNAGAQNVSLAAGKVYYIMNPSAILFFLFEVAYSGMVSDPDTDYSLFTNAIKLDMGRNIVGLPFDNHGLEEVNIIKSTINYPKGILIDWLVSQRSNNIYKLNVETMQPYWTMYDLAHINVTNTITASITGGGEIIDYVAKKRGLGITEGSLTWAYISPGSTFNGVTITNRVSNVLSWTADTITFGGTTISNNDSVPD